MKRLTLIVAFLGLLSYEALAQQPKMYLKIYGGVHVHKYILRGESDIYKDVYGGWQGGFGFRVSWRRTFGEIGVDFIRSRETLEVTDSTGTQIPVQLQVNSFNIPLKIGGILVKSPWFKWYIYTGLGTRINTRMIFTVDDVQNKVKPKDIGLKGYNLDWIVGTQTDLGWLNIDFYYALGITNATRTNIRTNSHELILNFGFLF